MPAFFLWIWGYQEEWRNDLLSIYPSNQIELEVSQSETNLKIELSCTFYIYSVGWSYINNFQNMILVIRSELQPCWSLISQFKVMAEIHPKSLKFTHFGDLSQPNSRCEIPFPKIWHGTNSVPRWGFAWKWHPRRFRTWKPSSWGEPFVKLRGEGFPQTPRIACFNDFFFGISFVERHPWGQFTTRLHLE